MTLQEQQYYYYLQRRRELLLRARYAAGIGDESRKPYDEIKKLTDSGFLNYIEYSAENLDPAVANEYLKSNPVADNVMCTGVHFGSTVVRHSDGPYNEETEFIVKVKADGKKALYSSIGFAAMSPKLKVADAEKLIMAKADADYLKVLPFTIVDGVNDQGIYVQCNHINSGVVVDINRGKSIECCGPTMVATQILNNVSAISELETFLGKCHMVGTFSSHILVADANGNSKIIEFENNSYEICEDAANSISASIITNFRMNRGVKFENNQLDWSTIEPYGNGVERWTEALSVKLSADPTAKGLIAYKDNLNYTNAYVSAVTANKTWLTDNLSGELDVSAAAQCHLGQGYTEEFNYVVSANYGDFINRSRSTGKTKHTTHACIYDLNKHSFVVNSQEISTCYNISFNGDFVEAPFAEDAFALDSSTSVVTVTNDKCVDANGMATCLGDADPATGLLTLEFE